MEQTVGIGRKEDESSWASSSPSRAVDGTNAASRSAGKEIRGRGGRVRDVQAKLTASLRQREAAALFRVMFIISRADAGSLTPRRCGSRMGRGERDRVTCADLDMVDEDGDGRWLPSVDVPVWTFERRAAEFARSRCVLSLYTLAGFSTWGCRAFSSWFVALGQRRCHLRVTEIGRIFGTATVTLRTLLFSEILLVRITQNSTFIWHSNTS